MLIMRPQGGAISICNTSQLIVIVPHIKVNENNKIPVATIYQSVGYQGNLGENGREMSICLETNS